NVHGVSGDSAVDLNRAGTPLIEIVGEPDLRSSAEAVAYMRAVREILLFVGVNDGNMEEGSFRCDANVSIRPRGQAEFGQRVELKNINSFRFVQKAIEVEVARQAKIIDEGGKVKQETRGFDADRGRTYSLRSKEDAHDYRYFPDPDLPPLVLSAPLIEEERRGLAELPGAVRARWQEEGIPEATAVTLTAHPAIVAFVEAVHVHAPEVPFKKLANFVQTEVLRGLVTHGLEARFTVSAGQVAELLSLGESGRISGKQVKEVFAAIENGTRSPAEVVAERGMEVVSDSGALEAQLRELIDQNPKQAEGLRAGKKQLAGFFVGQIMKATGGSADPKLVTDLLEKLIAGE
ncbi:MAG TPA: Asp-tRNA(Asn)/Glu-tRNA(Gln) amidotransferase subunit GatB, partial [Polyangiaceae bacterium]|nr:Asp-tRNA(Asn)/Glu-tRNA(Gln) amidotransferase subunit GatB [Polyangiaceae bacterium]